MGADENFLLKTVPNLIWFSTFLSLSLSFDASFIDKGVKKLREFDGHGRSTPLRTTSIGFHSSTPWNATGFYYSPRYPESYRGRVKNSR